MAYAAVVTGPFVVPHGAGEGGQALAFKVVETEAGATSDVFELPGCPSVGRIVAFKMHLVSGTGVPGATIQPEIGLSAAWTANTVDHVATAAAAAGFINDVAAIPYVGLNAFTSPPDDTSSLFIRNECSNNTADHVIHTFIVIAQGAI